MLHYSESSPCYPIIYCHLNLAGCRGSTNTPRQQGSHSNWARLTKSKKSSSTFIDRITLRKIDESLRQWRDVLREEEKTPQLITISFLLWMPEEWGETTHPQSFHHGSRATWMTSGGYHSSTVIQLDAITAYFRMHHNIVSIVRDSTHTKMSRWI